MATNKNLAGGARMSPYAPQLVVDVQIVGQSSPRWASATSEGDRVANNQRLSDARSQAVERLIEQNLKKALAPANLTFQYNQSYPDNSSVPDQTVLVDASGRGQSESVLAAHGDRRNNDPKFRRVDVRIRIAHRLQEDVPRRVVRQYQRSSKTKHWFVSVAAGVSIAYVVSGSLLFVKLRNEYGQTAVGQGLIGGAGIGVSLVPGFGKIPHASASFGHETAFHTDVPVGFEVFDGIGINYGSVSVGLFGGGRVALLSFYKLGWGAKFIFLKGLTLGAQAGAQIADGNGVLWLDSVPPDYVIQRYSRTEFDRYKSLWVTDHRTAIFFATGSAEVLVGDKLKLDDVLVKTVTDVFAT